MNIGDFLNNADFESDGGKHRIEDMIKKMGLNPDDVNVSRVNNFIRKNDLTKNDFINFVDRMSSSEIARIRSVSEFFYVVGLIADKSLFNNEEALINASKISSFNDIMGPTLLSHYTTLDKSLSSSKYKNTGYVEYLSVISPISYGILLRPKNNIGDVVIEVLKDKCKRMHGNVISFTDIAKEDPGNVATKYKLKNILIGLEPCFMSAYDQANACV